MRSKKSAPASTASLFETEENATPVKRRSRGQKPAQPIGFRAEEKYHQALQARAKELNTTISDVVKGYVVEKLRDDAAEASAFDTLQQLHGEITELRRDIALLAEALLCGAGKFNEKEARQWAKENLRAD